MSVRVELTVTPTSAHPLLFRFLRLPLGKLLEPWLEAPPASSGATTRYRLRLEDGEAITIDNGAMGSLTIGVEGGHIALTVPRLLAPSLKHSLGPGTLVRIDGSQATLTAPWTEGSTVDLPVQRLGVRMQLALLGGA